MPGRPRGTLAGRRVPDGPASPVPARGFLDRSVLARGFLARGFLASVGYRGGVHCAALTKPSRNRAVSISCTTVTALTPMSLGARASGQTWARP